MSHWPVDVVLGGQRLPHGESCPCCDLAVRGSSKRLLLQHPANQTKTHNVFSGLDPRTRKLGLVNNPTRSFLCVWHSGIHVWLPCCLTLIKRVVVSGNGYFCKRRSHRSGVILTIRENLMRIDPIKCGLSTISLSFSLWFSRSIYLYIYIYMHKYTLNKLIHI